MKNVISDIKFILESAQKPAYSAISTSMVAAYWQVGKRIVDEEQLGNEKATYATFLIKNISKGLTLLYGKGFSDTNVKSFRQFYLIFPQLLLIGQTVSDELRFKNLSWSHFQN